jgi:UDP-glucose 4-epimerase
MVLPNFVSQALDGEPITVFGTGQQSRCFCDVRDSVQAIMRLVACEKAIGEVINIGNTHEITIEGLAHLVKQRTNSSSPITYVPYDQAYEPGFEDMPRRVPALGKLERLTGFLPAIALNDIVDSVINYFQNKKIAGKPNSVMSDESDAVGRMVAGSSAS